MTGIIDSVPSSLPEQIKSGSVTLGVYGLGWMGLPTACLFADAGANVLGVDLNPVVIDAISKGKSPVEEPGLESILKRQISSGRLKVTTDPRGAAAKCDVIVVVVPTLIDSRSVPDYSAVERAGKDIGFGIKGGNLIILESTVGPGTTEGLFREALQRSSGLVAGKDFCLSYSPIRATSGRTLKDIVSYPRVVAGIDERSAELASSVMSCIVKGQIVRVSSPKAAETTKLFENIYRDVNIALANELGLLCGQIGIDFHEVRDAANSQPYSQIHMPGIGVGGHCIPFNPYFLIDVAEKAGANLKLVRLSRRINDSMPGNTVKLVLSALRSCGKATMRSTIAVFGISYRANVKEERFSPSVQVLEMLSKRGITVRAYDPHFSSTEIESIGLRGAGTPEAAVENADGILLAVGHDEFRTLEWSRLVRLMKKSPFVVDCSHVLKKSVAEEFGIKLVSLGVGT